MTNVEKARELRTDIKRVMATGLPHVFVSEQLGANEWSSAYTSYCTHCGLLERAFEEERGRIGARCDTREEAEIARLLNELVDLVQEGPTPVDGAVYEDGGVSLIRRGSEDARCDARGAKRLYFFAGNEPKRSGATA